MYVCKLQTYICFWKSINIRFNVQTVSLKVVQKETNHLKPKCVELQSTVQTSFHTQLKTN